MSTWQTKWRWSAESGPWWTRSAGSLRPAFTVVTWPPAGNPQPRGRGMLVAVVVALLALAAQMASGQEKPTDVFKQVGFDQNLERQVPANLEFRNETGQPVKLGDYFGDKPSILCLVYYRCPRLCNLQLNGLVRGLRAMDWTVGEEFNIITVSFDPRDTTQLAAEKRQSYLRQYGRPDVGEGWHFLTGKADAIQQLTSTVGYRYKYDESKDEFAHASGVVLLTPDGRISRYLYGIDFAPRDLRLGLVEASEGEIGSPVDQLLLMCYGYDAVNGRYGLMIMNSIRVLGVLTVLGLGTFVGVMVLRDSKLSRRAPSDPEPQRQDRSPIEQGSK